MFHLPDNNCQYVSIYVQNDGNGNLMVAESVFLCRTRCVVICKDREGLGMWVKASFHKKVRNGLW